MEAILILGGVALGALSTFFVMSHPRKNDSSLLAYQQGRQDALAEGCQRCELRKAMRVVQGGVR